MSFPRKQESNIEDMEIALRFIKKLMNIGLKVKYSSLNDNSIAFDGHLFLGEIMKYERKWEKLHLGFVGNSANQTWLKFAYVAHILTPMLFAKSGSMGFHSTSAVGHCLVRGGNHPLPLP
jgi:hypothetical protein